ncbi:MAG TPA: hypothetical protein VF519_12610 [Mycobacteriales bacterium]|jgi:hypothetical protein
MRRLLALAVLAASATLPVPGASACDPNQDPRCLGPGSLCTTVDRWWDQVERILADPPQQPVC